MFHNVDYRMLKHFNVNLINEIGFLWNNIYICKLTICRTVIVLLRFQNEKPSVLSPRCQGSRLQESSEVKIAFTTRTVVDPGDQRVVGLKFRLHLNTVDNVLCKMRLKSKWKQTIWKRLIGCYYVLEMVYKF